MALIYPRMLEYLLSRDPLMGLLNQKSANEIARLVGYAVGEVVSALLNTGEQQLLARLTILATLPAAVGAAIAAERRIAAQQNVENNAEAPQVAALVVVAGLADERLDHLGRHELGTAHRGEQLRRRHWTRLRVVELDARAKIKVAHLDGRQFLRVHAQNVLRLEISMSNACNNRFII